MSFTSCSLQWTCWMCWSIIKCRSWYHNQKCSFFFPPLSSFSFLSFSSFFWFFEFQFEIKEKEVNTKRMKKGNWVVFFTSCSFQWMCWMCWSIIKCRSWYHNQKCFFSLFLFLFSFSFLILLLFLLFETFFLSGRSLSHSFLHKNWTSFSLSISLKDLFSCREKFVFFLFNSVNILEE